MLSRTPSLPQLYLLVAMQDGSRQVRLLVTRRVKGLPTQALEGFDAPLRLVRHLHVKPLATGPLTKLERGPLQRRRQKCLDRVAKHRPAYPQQLARVFQALRIAANDEHAHLASFLRPAPSCLARESVALITLCYQPREDSAVQAAAEVLCAVRPPRSPSSGGLGACRVRHGRCIQDADPS